MQEIKPETICHIASRARQLNVEGDVLINEEEREGDVEQLIEDVELGRAVHTEHEREPAYLELRSFIDDLSLDEQYELIALAWLGRGDGTKANWDELVELAEERHTKRTGDYLLAMPLLADYLEDALHEFDISCADFEGGHG